MQINQTGVLGVRRVVKTHHFSELCRQFVDRQVLLRK